MAGIGEQIKSANRTVSKWAEKTTSAVSEWWEHLNAIQERRDEVRELARERQKLLVEMGAKVYTLHRRGKVQNRDLLRDCDRMDTIGSDIERLEREITELRRLSMASEPRRVVVEDDTPVVGEEDVEVAAVEDTPETDKEATIPCAHAHTAVEGPREGEETAEASVECPIEPPAGDIQQETDKEGAVPCAHAEDAVEGPVEGDDESHARPECEI
jgi:hypothetical protein